MSTRKEIIVCPRCGGRGVITNPSIYPEGGGFTQSEWAELDYDSQDMYMDGAYDVRCPDCKGRNVVEVEIHLPSIKVTVVKFVVKYAMTNIGALNLEQHTQ